MLDIKKNFPMFSKNKELVYLDNAGTTQIPLQTIKSLDNFYRKENASMKRGIYPLSENATKKFEKAREVITEFINASKDEIIFTKNTTESINLVAGTFDSLIENPSEKEILITEMEHHSNFVPWQMASKKLGMKLNVVKISSKLNLDLSDLKEKINEKTAVFAFTYISNITGTINPAEEIISIIKRINPSILVVLDAAQAVAHTEIDVKKIGCDFLAFSGHKIYSPSGVGVLYGKKELLKKMHPFTFGGGMIKNVTLENTTFAELPDKFEAGTQNPAGGIALAKSISYLKKIGIKKIKKHEQELLCYALAELKKISGIKIYAPEGSQSSIISFNVLGFHPHDVASILAEKNICVRAGHHCGMPLLKRLNSPEGTVRISFGMYNMLRDIDKLISELKQIAKLAKND